MTDDLAATQQDEADLEEFPSQPIDTSHFFITDKNFQTRDEMKEEVERMGKLHYIHVINFSYSEKRGDQYYACDRSGKYRPRKRNLDEDKLDGSSVKKYTGSRKCDCPFRLKGYRRKDGIWKLEVLNGLHNHFIGSDPYGHAKVGRITKEMKEKILKLDKSNVGTAEILINLADDNNMLQRIYNLKQRQKAKEREGRSAAEQLLKDVISHQCPHWYQTIPIAKESSELLTDVLLAHRSSLDMLRQYPFVLQFDVTYATNVHKMPLLEVIGVTPTNHNFSVFFGFLENEQWTAYDWALKCIREVLNTDDYPIVFVTDREQALMSAIETHFPCAKLHLCRRHIEKDVEAWVNRARGGKAGAKFVNGVWKRMVNSINEEEFIENEKKLYAFTYDEDKKMVKGVEKYCKEIWLDKYKEKFVAAWTNKVSHFGNVTTNRVESAHASLKRLLKTSTGSLDTVFEKIISMIELQQRHIKYALGRSKTVAVNGLVNKSVFSKLTFHVTHHAIKLLDNALTEGQCEECAFKSIYGLPCPHEIVNLVKEGKSVELNSVHPFWKTLEMTSASPKSVDDVFVREKNKLRVLVDEAYETDEILVKRCCEAVENILRPMNIEDPTVKKTRGRPKKNSTKRNLSHWEHLNKKLYRGRGRGRAIKKTRGEGSSCTSVQTDGEKAHTISISSLKVNTLEISSHPFAYSQYIPEWLLPYIIEWLNVKPDGNCGFRAIARQIYGDQEKWPQVRRDLLNEIMEDRLFYESIDGGQHEIDQLCFRLSHWEGPAPEENWFTTALGLVVSNTYNGMFISFVTQDRSRTWIPTKESKGVKPGKEVEITVAYIEELRHFVWVRLTHEHPIPTLYSLCNPFKQKNNNSFSFFND